MKLKRIMAMVLCVAMVLSTMSFNVFAEGNIESYSISTNEDLATALTSDEENVAITLENSIDLGETALRVTGEGKKTIDFNGFTVTSNCSGTQMVYVTGGSELVLMDSSVAQNGGLYATKEDGTLSNLIRVESDGKLIIESGNYHQVASNNGSGMIDARSTQAPTITIKGGTFTLDNIGTASNGSPWILNVSGKGDSYIIVTGGTFNTNIQRQYWATEVNVPESHYIKKNENNTWAVEEGSVISVKEGTLTGPYYEPEYVVGYPSLQAFFDAANANDPGTIDPYDPITLLTDNNDDVNIDIIIHEPDNLTERTVTLDLNRHQYTGKITLSNEDIVLNSGADLNVVSGVAGYEVQYADDAYRLVESTEQYVAQIGNDKYTSLQTAINVAQGGDVITVIAGHELTWDGNTFIDGSMAAMVVVAGKDVTIDLNGKSLTVDADEMTENLFAIFAADDGGSLTLKDTIGEGSVIATGTAYASSGTTAYCMLMGYENGTKLTVEGGSYFMEGAHDSLIYGGGGSDIVYIKGGNFDLGNKGIGENGKPWLFNVYGAGDNHANVTGGTFTADINRQHWSNEVVVPETHYTVVNEDGTYTVWEGAVAYVNEGMVTGTHFVPKNIGYKTFEEAVEAAVTKNDSPITLLQDAEVTGNVVIGEDTSLNCNEHKIILASKTATLTAPEGLAVTTNLEGYVLVYANGTYALAPVVAKIGDDEYTSMAGALADAQDNNTITVVSDIENAENITIDNLTVVIDLGEHTFNGSILVPTGNVTIMNGSIVNTDSAVSAIEINSGKLNLTNVNIDSARHAVRIDGEVEAVIDGGTYKIIGSGQTQHAVNVSGNADVIVKNGTFTGPRGTTADSGAAVNVQAGATVTIEDGTFTGGKNNTLAAKGTLSVLGGTFDQDPTAYVAENLNVIHDRDRGLYIVAAGWIVSATADDEDKTVEAGDKVKITIKASGDNFSAAEWKLYYDADKFELNETFVIDEGNDDLVKTDTDGKKYISGLVWDSAANDKFTSDSVLAVYEFTAKALQKEEIGAFELKNASVGTGAMSGAEYPAAQVSEAEKIKNILKDFNAIVQYNGEDVVNNKVDIHYDGNAHKIDVTTEPDAKVLYLADDGQTWTEEVPTFTEYGEHTLTYKVEVPDGYDQTAKTFVTITVNITEPEKVVEVVNYVPGYKLVLVYTDSDGAYFTYGNNTTLMLDVTARGYMYEDETGVVYNHPYKHVYAYVVPREMKDATTAQDNDFYKSNVKFANDAIGTPNVVAPYDFNVNCDPENETIANLADVVYTAGVHNAKDDSMIEEYMKKILKADVFSSKTVNNDDITAVKDDYDTHR